MKWVAVKCYKTRPPHKRIESSHTFFYFYIFIFFIFFYTINKKNELLFQMYTLFIIILRYIFK
jgi:hypothetical protein